MTKRVDFGKFDNSWYKSGNLFKKLLWYIVNIYIIKSSIPYPNFIKIFFLRLFGSKIGKSVVIKPNVNIKFPWFLKVGDHVWIGEDVWIDNLTDLTIGNNVCISQGAYICAGNHNYKKVSFDLIVEPIVIEDGVWVGAKVVVCPGVTLRTHSVITAGSVIFSDTEPYKVYHGNPANFKRDRVFSDERK